MYWLVSSLIFHLWFVGGGAAVTMGLERPSYYILAIPGFQASHLARVFAAFYQDEVASIFEVVGICVLGGCVAIGFLDKDSTVAIVWLIVAVVERCSHFPAAFRGDASWMRSFDLWKDMVAKHGSRRSEINRHGKNTSEESII